MRARLIAAAIASPLAAAGAAALGSRWGLPWWGVGLIVLGLGTAVATLALDSAWRRARLRLEALADGVRGFAENDFSLRVAADGDDEVAALAALFNAAGTELRAGRFRSYEREVLLDTLLQSAPMGVTLVDQNGRVAYANRAAWQLLGAKQRLEGRRFDEIRLAAPALLQQALGSDEVGVVRLTPAEGADEELFRIVRQRMSFSGHPHLLLIFERITADLLRREILVWKKVIRLMTHELNNSLSPISSLLHSAKTVARAPNSSPGQPTLEELLDLVGTRVQQLAGFLESYARFARLPSPQLEWVYWRPFLERLSKLIPFQIEGAIDESPVRFDPSQIEQVLINLLKNAEEGGGPRDAIAVRIEPQPDDLVLVSVLDRGKGMSAEECEAAIEPFYTRKPGGSGLGLALCREIVDAHGGRLLLQPRSGGGLAARCVLRRDPLEVPRNRGLQ